ncbi:MAG TPA: putative metal-binding motif-containing protein [bacterium]|nr:putative metal-binding motif-containing protein [bacterium]
MDLKIFGSKLTYFKYTIWGNITNDAGVDVNVPIANYHPAPWQLSMPEIPLGGVPIFGPLYLGLSLQPVPEFTASVDAAFEAHTGYHASAAFEEGFEYVDGSVHVIHNTPPPIFEVYPPTWDIQGSASLQATLWLKIKATISGLAGPVVALGPFARATGEFTANPLSCPVDIGLGLDGYLAFDFSVLGKWFDLPVVGDLNYDLINPDLYYPLYQDDLCEGTIVCTDNDHDGYYTADGCGTDVDCNDGNFTIHPGATEICGDGIDQDCVGGDQACPCADNDGDGYTSSACGGPDCNDNNSSIHPGATEICGDGIDQDCVGGDQACACADNDGDGYTSSACGGPDCDDADPTVYPGAVEYCDISRDGNCNGLDDFSDGVCDIRASANFYKAYKVKMYILNIGDSASAEGHTFKLTGITASNTYLLSIDGGSAVEKTDALSYYLDNNNVIYFNVGAHSVSTVYLIVGYRSDADGFASYYLYAHAGETVRFTSSRTYNDGYLYRVSKINSGGPENGLDLYYNQPPSGLDEGWFSSGSGHLDYNTTGLASGTYGFAVLTDGISDYQYEYLAFGKIVIY